MVKSVSTNIQTEELNRRPKKHQNTTCLKEKNKTEKKPHNRLRYDQINHLPEVDKNRNSTRCKNEDCKHKSHIWCSKCNVHLCLQSNRNCFKDFHIF